MEIDNTKDIMAIVVLIIFFGIGAVIILMLSLVYTDYMNRTVEMPEKCSNVCNVSNLQMVNYTEPYCYCKNNIGIQSQIQLED